MKIGILTFHRAHNCGAMLQNYALQFVLKRMGADAVTIDFNDIGEEFRSFRLMGRTSKIFIGNVLSFVLSLVFYDLRIARFNRFRRHYLKTTEKISNDKLPQNFDAYVVGSDQVFQPNLTKAYLRSFLLEGISPEKRFSYAASFGYDSLPMEFREIYRLQLSKFSAISVREDSGVNIIKRELCLDIPVVSVLDPTLLLTAADYDEIVTAQRIPQKYVLVYSIGGGEAALRRISAGIAKRKKMKVVYVNACRRSYFKTPWGDLITTSPDRLVYLIKHASYVVTTSFHGVALSIVFRRQFLAVIPLISKVAGRVPSLLKLLSIPNRALPDNTTDDEVVVVTDNDIDYERVETRLDGLRDKSLQFLSKIISSAKVEVVEK